MGEASCCRRAIERFSREKSASMSKNLRLTYSEAL